MFYVYEWWYVRDILANRCRQVRVCSQPLSSSARVFSAVVDKCACLLSRCRQVSLSSQPLSTSERVFLAFVDKCDCVLSRCRQVSVSSQPLSTTAHVFSDTPPSPNPSPATSRQVVDTPCSSASNCATVGTVPSKVAPCTHLEKIIQAFNQEHEISIA